ncbi:toprim domain-containing protein [Phenylobacterium sp.]|jgi:hypothetical protein|uniref:toprim domain-containing protein n=1 Tax=Phenylobacterium sp. TaxID=1871053 RepID=UPI002F938662
MPRSPTTLLGVVRALGGDLYDGGRRANVPAPGHSPADRSVSLWLSGDRVIVHGFGACGWREVLDHLRGLGLVDASGRLVGAPGASQARDDPPPSDRKRQDAAAALWAGGRPVRAGSPAALYALRRAVRRDLAAVEALRFHPGAPLSVYRGTGGPWPALLAAVRGADGGLCAVEVTYLTAAGRRAEGLRLPRKTVGRLPPAAAVRLDPAAPELLVAEGIWTALSAGERFGAPAWALLSAARLARWTPPSGVRRLLIAADPGKAGERAAAALAARAAGAGLSAAVRLPPPGVGDWNDLAVMEAEEGRRGVVGARGRSLAAGPERPHEPDPPHAGGRAAGARKADLSPR